VASVAQLTSYPIKGCAGVTTAQSFLTPAGLRHDRTFMVTDEDGTYRSQRRDYRLALIAPDLDDDGQKLTLRADGFADLGPLDVDLSSGRRPVRLFGHDFTGIDQGAEVAAWLSEVLGKPSRLVRLPPEHARVTDGATAGTSGYADSNAVLMLSDRSLESLNAAIGERGGGAVPMNRFRPNIVVAGWDAPHLEDTVRHVRIGEAELGFAKLAIRCSVTLVDQRTGLRAGPEPLRTLASYRRLDNAGVAFGSKFSTARPGTIAVGDELDITEWAS
jgi:MOSC domain-containing protein